MIDYAALAKETRPDWSHSETPIGSVWKSPLFPNHVNLEVADGAIHFRDQVIQNLRQQLKELEKTSIEGFLSLPG